MPALGLRRAFTAALVSAIVVLSVYILGYLVLCGYAIAKTGATTGLSDIGSTALIVAVGALAVLVKGGR